MVNNYAAADRRMDRALRALASPARRAIVEQLFESQRTVGEIASRMDMTVAAVSKNLDVLVRARLVERRRAGRESHCRLSREGLEEAGALLDRYRSMWTAQLDSLGRFLDDPAEDK